MSRLTAHLAGQLEALGMEMEAAARVAANRVRALDPASVDGGAQPYFVLPTSRGWVVARAFSHTGREQFSDRDEALSRAEHLAAADSAEVIVCEE